MGCDFDIIDDTGNLIDRYSINWLIQYYDTDFFSNYSTSSIGVIIRYCNEEKEKNNFKLNKFKCLFDCICENDLDKKKTKIIEIIEKINDKEELQIILYCLNETKIEDDYIKLYEYYLNQFISFEEFLSKYNIGYKFEISF